MPNHNVLLLCGGGSSEHEVSLRSADFIEAQLSAVDDVSLLRVEIGKDHVYRTTSGDICRLTDARRLVFDDPTRAPWRVDFAVPCIHGAPGETGEVQAWFDLIALPFLGCGSESSTLCFNKISTKLWLTALGIPNTPSIFVTSTAPDELAKAHDALARWGSVFVKAASQGSSVGCYRVDDPSALDAALGQAFGYAPYVLIEQTIRARELEVAAYEYDGQIVATVPGEVHSPSDTFYTYDEKYGSDSHSLTDVEATNLSTEQLAIIHDAAVRAFRGLKLRHLSRIDFFLTADGQIYLNEINTFPGLTPISMFPKMMEHHGHDFSRFLANIIRQSARG